MPRNWIEAMMNISSLSIQPTAVVIELTPTPSASTPALKTRTARGFLRGDILGSRYYYLSPDNVAVEVVKWFCNSWVIQEGDRPPTMLEEDEIMPYSVVIGNVHDNKELWGGNKL